MRAISVDTNQWMVTATENEILDRARHVILGAFTLRHDDRERAAGVAVCKKRGAWITPVVLTLQSVTYICIYICMLESSLASHLSPAQFPGILLVVLGDGKENRKPRAGHGSWWSISWT